MASGDTLLTFLPLRNEPPASNYALLGLRNSIPVLKFDDTTSWAAVFTEVLPSNYSGGGLTVYIHATALATSGTMGWLVSFERMSDSSTDLDSDSFAGATTITAATVPGTSGIALVLNASITDGANIDGMVAGDGFRIKIARDVANDTAVGNVELLAVEVRET